MNRIFKVFFLLFISIAVLTSFIQKEKPLYSFGGKTGNCTMTWDEFLACKKELVTNDKALMVGSFLLTISKVTKKDSLQIEYPAKGNAFSKAANESIKSLHDDKKMGRKVTIDHVMIQESGKAAREVPGMIIILN
jgi:hypothetical protein